jgi:3-oxoacyl-[acyl-carrier-protein] synthase-1
MSAPVFISHYSVACALGMDRARVSEMLFSDAPPKISDAATLNDDRVVPVGRLPKSIEHLEASSRTNRIVAHCYQSLSIAVADAIERFGAERVGVVLGTSTSGIGEGGEALREKFSTGMWPSTFSLAPQQLGDSARFAATLSGARGPYYVVSTACTSGGRALIAGARLIGANICDAVLCGGVDSLCDLTLNGFAALDSLSSAVCNPMSANRDGLNLGEGGALFLLTREPGPFRLAGWGESVDGHHMSAPDPEGKGAERAIRKALAMTQLPSAAIDFMHLHGTATRLNDQMEAAVVALVLGVETPCASTKPLSGHTLGAAGAVQAAFCLMAMERGQFPPHIWDGERDPELAQIRLANPGERAPLKHILSASYAFGGNNAALAFAAS